MLRKLRLRRGKLGQEEDLCTYGKKQVNAIEKLIDEDPDVTCHQVKLRLLKLLKGVG